jgi:ATPase family associated with various cellular activities (AAA)
MREKKAKRDRHRNEQEAIGKHRRPRKVLRDCVDYLIHAHDLMRGREPPPKKDKMIRRKNPDKVRKPRKRYFSLKGAPVVTYGMPRRFSKKETQPMKQNIWAKDHSAVQDTSAQCAPISKFMENMPGETLTIRLRFTIDSSMLAIADDITKLLDNKGLASVIKSDEFEWVGVESEECVVIVSFDRRSGYAYDEYGGYDANEEGDPDLFKSRLGVYIITMAGDRRILTYLYSKLHEKYREERYARVKWWYKSDRGSASYQTTYLDKPKAVVRPEFYPDLKVGNKHVDPETYIKAYLNSDASVLLVAGDAGTGKTTLLRQMIYAHNLTASVVYDEELMEKDNVFQSFLFNKEDDMLIIEDADAILSPRDSDKNTLMSRFLNVSDGLIKLPNKKLVFTTNLTDFGRIDAALLRPGRCFDLLKTRALTYDEAVRAANAAGLPVPLDQKSYTVAELFNQGSNQRAVRRAGFV